ncbi:hydroxyacylglutathione hydrolase [Pseudomonas syringae]|uniref:FAD/NAD(P)-binding protein n=1 Tax=Pseudomonas syringae TaxID=317 RepID=UPI001CA7ECAB|nr:FAD/NAD(P)-binding protein [Pseudomonas syringae]MCI3943873.1 hydroxyacylglutathione hydrolase [Pseudomonas syringae]
MKTLAIVGAGFCGAVAAIEFIKACRVPAKLIIIEQTGTFGPGVAYGGHNQGHVLNVPAGNMSALWDHPDSFVEYCINNDLETHPGDFVLRQEYGRYLSMLLDNAIASCRGTLEVERIHAEAIQIKKRGDRATVILRDQRCLNVEHVLLACGNFPPSTPQPLVSFKDHPAYQDAPWSSPRTDSRAVRPSDSVLLIGSGLTALDMVARLTEGGHMGQVTALSRRGLQPQVHRGHSHYAAHHSQTTRDVVCKADATALAYMKTVRRLISESLDVDWRDIVAALRPCTPELWRRLPPLEKRRFLRHVRPYWDNHRHRAAPEANAIFERLRQSGRLSVVKGRLLAVNEVDNKLVCDISTTADQTITQNTFDVVINCTGPNTSVLTTQYPLIQQLLKDGIIVPDLLGLGIVLSEDFSAVTCENEVVKWLSYVGPMLKSMFWEATAVPELRQHVSTHAARLAQRFNNDSDKVG